MLTEEGIRYAWDQICQRMGLSRPLSQAEILLRYQESAIGEGNGKVVFNIHRSTDAHWQALLHQAEGSVKWVGLDSLMPGGEHKLPGETIPILFPANQEISPGRLIEYDQEQNILTINFDIIAATFIMLTRWEETVIQTRDQHERFPATASIAYRQGFLSRPLVDEYAKILGEWLRSILPGFPFMSHVYRVQVSHDIDHLGGSVNPIVTALKMLKNYALHWDKKIFLDDFNHITAGHGLTPDTWSASQLVEWAQEFKYKPRFYFMTASKSAFDEGYDPGKPDEMKLINTLIDSGFEIGLHAGYATMRDKSVLTQEKERLEKVAGYPVTSVRQHYLRVQAPYTWRLWQEVGFLHDSSLGFSDVPGFRCGTCHPYHLFDLEQNRELDIIEEPLIVMDTTLFDKQEKSFVDAETEIYALAASCKAVGGVFSILWHNTSLIHTRYYWGQFFYRMIPALLPG